MSGDGAGIPPVDPSRDHIRGAADGRVTLVEYGDFQCPFCGDAYPIVHTLLRELGWLRFVFRHMPLTDLHPRAWAAAEASEAAAAQGRFWEMHDRLFEHQHALRDDDLREHAATLRLDVGRFDRELREGVHAARVEEDYRSGAASGIPSTPRFFVEGGIHLGSPTEIELRRAVEAAY
jgi:Na+:H+ antiporter, NhaA family